jgi:hypothetical protein
MEIEAKAAKPKHAVLTFNFYKMSSLTTFVDCPNLQSRLEDTFCMGASEPLPIIGFLFSPENNAQLLERNAVPTAGKKRIVELVYSRQGIGSGSNQHYRLRHLYFNRQAWRNFYHF